jgi:hypothetical protein
VVIARLKLLWAEEAETARHVAHADDKAAAHVGGVPMNKRRPGTPSSTGHALFSFPTQSKRMKRLLRV